MTPNTENQEQTVTRWRYVLLAALILVLMSAVMAGLWQVYRALPQVSPSPSAASPSDTLPPPSATPTPTITPTPTPAITQPTINGIDALVDEQGNTLTFHLDAKVPPDRGVSQVLLWYDTETGHQLQRFSGPMLDSFSLSYELDPTLEGLTRTLTTTQELDYWWLVRDTSGDTARAGGTAILGPLQALVVTPPPEPPPVDFTWAVSDTQHFQFHYMPGTAAERDLPQLGELAEGSLAHISSVLDVEYDEQMSIYFVPRIFWQGGAAYGGKVQLISYLDRNYTGIETWSYFTHEGTHALAQDLIQPKEGEGGPDGVLVEGLAVWASGGHYRLEPIDAWAAVVASSDQYLPLPDLRAGPFYDFQHETSYLEGASFVQYLVEQYGLDKLKELYGRATGDAEHDSALVELLYGQDYASLEAEWLAYLWTLSPTPEEVDAWQLKVRSFDLMRRYETELDPDARLLPPKAPPEWMSDTLKIFLGRTEAPVNIILETVLIAAQERLAEGDPAGAAALLDDVEAALDAGGELIRPSLLARQSILEALAAQDRAVLIADADAYRRTLDPNYAKLLGDRVEEALQVPFVAYRQEVVRLDVHENGLGADAVVLVHARIADEVFDDDGQLSALRLIRATNGWQVASREPWASDLSLPLPVAD
jgi:hypothetical protein